jgi:hypothetical protein
MVIFMTNTIAHQLVEPQFDYISVADKEFIVKFDAEMETSGYSADGVIFPGHRDAPLRIDREMEASGFPAAGVTSPDYKTPTFWGRHMLFYTKIGVKSKSSFPRIYCCDDGIILRLYCKDIAKHIAFIEAAPEHIRAPFGCGFGGCRHCKETCGAQKTYMLNGELYEKCDGYVQFFSPDIIKLPDYVALFHEFYPVKPAYISQGLK